MEERLIDDGCCFAGSARIGIGCYVPPGRQENKVGRLQELTTGTKRL